jgi:hypothetical protein
MFQKKSIDNLYDYLTFQSESICKNRTKIIKYSGQKGIYEIHLFIDKRPNNMIGSIFFTADNREINKSTDRLSGLFKVNDTIKGDKPDFIKQTKTILIFEVQSNRDVKIIADSIKPLNKVVKYAI